MKIQLLQQIKNKSVPITLFLICCLGSLRIIHINHSFWQDEITTSWVIGGNFADIFTRCWINNLSPLYFIFIYFSKSLFGYSEFALRIPGLITGILTIPIVYKIAHKLNSSAKLSLFAAFLASIDFWLVYYSLEVRPYSFVVFLSAIHIYIFLLFLKNNKPIFYAVLLGLMSGLIVVMHYTAATLCLVEFFIAIIYFYKEKNFSKEIIYGLLIYAIVPLVILLPFAPHIKYLFANKTLLGSFIEKQDIASIFLIYPHFINYMLLPLIIGFFVEYTRKKDTSCNLYTFEIFFILSWYFIPVFTHWITTNMDIAHIFRDRYLAWIMPAPIIGSVIIIKNFQSKLAKTTFITVLLLLTITDYFPDFNLRFFNDIFKKNYQQNVESNITSGEFGWKEAVNFINRSNLNLNKIYVIPGLVESEMLHMHIHDDKLLKSYLLSSVNSIYKLAPSYLNIAEPIYSVADIPDSASNYLIISYGFPLDIKNSTEISPKENVIVYIYHIK